jgi:hypothetical protein
MPPGLAAVDRVRRAAEAVTRLVSDDDIEPLRSARLHISLESSYNWVTGDRLEAPNCFLRSLRCSAIFADQAAEDLPTLDPAGDIDGVGALAQRTSQPQPLVRPYRYSAARTRPGPLAGARSPRISTWSRHSRRSVFANGEDQVGRDGDAGRLLGVAHNGSAHDEAEPQALKAAAGPDGRRASRSST